MKPTYEELEAKCQLQKDKLEAINKLMGVIESAGDLAKDGIENLEQQLSESRREFWAADATINNLEMKLAEMAAQLANAENKCAALAVENAALKQSEKEFNNFCRQEYYGWEDNFTETPATDALLAEVRAQGVDMARNAMIDFVDGEVGPNKNVPGLIRGAEICVSIAEQLRKGGNQ